MGGNPITFETLHTIYVTVLKYTHVLTLSTCACDINSHLVSSSLLRWVELVDWPTWVGVHCQLTNKDETELKK